MAANTALSALLGRRDGSVGVTGAMSLPALLLAVGASIDYGRVELVRSQMQAAADAAVLSITQAQLLTTGSPAAGVEPFVDAHLASIDTLTVTDVDVVQDDGGYARVEISGDVDMLLLDVFSGGVFAVSVVSEAQYDLTFDLEFTIAIDNSESMLFAATPDGVSQMEGAASCAFACHIDAGWHNGWSYDWAVDNGVELRLDAGRSAILDAFDIAENHDYAEHANIHFDVYTFWRDLQAVGDGDIGAGLDDLAEAVAAIAPAPKATTGNIYRVTNFIDTMEELTPIVLERAAEFPDRDHFLLLVTDGVSNFDTNNDGSGPRRVEPFPAEMCEAIKSAGVRIGVVYTTYFEFPSNHTWSSYVQPINDDIAPRLEECASDTWFFEAQYGDDIRDALERMMLQAIPIPTLTE